MHIALASCADLPGWEVDDYPFHRALEVRGASFTTPVWDDPTVDWTAFDACVIRTTWDYMERRGEFVDWAERVAECSRLFNPPPVVRWSTCKTYLRELSEHGLPVAPTIWVEAGERVQVADALDGRGWQKAFIKPMIGASARETLPFETDTAGLAAAQAHLARLLPREGVLIQPFLESVLSEGEYSVLFIDGQITHVVRKIPVPGDYRVMDDFGARDEPAELPSYDLDLAVRAREMSESLLGCEEPLMYGRVDLLRDGMGQFVVNEVELVEPSFFFRHSGAAAEALATAVLARIG